MNNLVHISKGTFVDPTKVIGVACEITGVEQNSDEYIDYMEPTFSVVIFLEGGNCMYLTESLDSNSIDSFVESVVTLLYQTH